MGTPLKQGVVSHAEVVEGDVVAALRSGDLGGGGSPVGAGVVQVAVCIAECFCEAAVDVELCGGRFCVIVGVVVISVGCRWWWRRRWRHYGNYYWNLNFFFKVGEREGTSARKVWGTEDAKQGRRVMMKWSDGWMMLMLTSTSSTDGEQVGAKGPIRANQTGGFIGGPDQNTVSCTTDIR